MNLREIKKLKVGDKFRRPSKNPHDDGWRVYTVVSFDGKILDFIDQHGYARCLRLLIWDSSFGDKEFMKLAEKIY